MITEVSFVAARLLLPTAAVLRFPPGRRAVRDPVRHPPKPVEAAVLHGGARGAARTALVELYLTGSVDAARRHTVRRDHGKPPQGRSELARAHYSALHGRLHPRRLERCDAVRRATAALARQLEREGLLLTRRRLFAVRTALLPVFAAAPVVALTGRGTPTGLLPLLLTLLADGVAALLWPWTRRTRRGAVLLARLRREHAAARRATGRQPDELLWSVALFGRGALRENLPRFTAESGLLGRPPREPVERHGGEGEAFASCGG
ncbi:MULTISPECIES: TIGR04222 domain-containing membrane protein [unclassified Streptomyces]|uniref:TIGR04222 domain-containing membrane protein n=1 Tax=unclassified Streptomyces TaxID=2593676 RepID=UPI002E34F04C|nr:TIGR04222 domain-containing membrane protein [Streptomyces sp. NBC_01278]